MNMHQRFLLLLALASVLPISADVVAGEPRGPDPLFQSHDVLDIHITGPMSTLIGERPDEEYLPAKVSWLEPGGERMTVDIGIRTRGNYRRQKDTCWVPPLRINFKKGDVENTLFHKQDAMKLVTHCKDRNEKYEQLVLKEYLIYRMLNALNDNSYRVRLLKVTYTDTEDDDDDRVAYGVLIEHSKRLAKRTGLDALEIPSTRFTNLEPAYTALTSVFHYMIGNTDYSPVAGPKDEECCHNADLFAASDGQVYPVPYDFDMSGMVDAPYATPNPRFKIRNVRQRLYRGHCMHNAHIADAVQTFLDKRESLYALVNDEPALSKRTSKSMLKYLDSFYDVISEPKRLDREIIRACRG